MTNPMSIFLIQIYYYLGGENQGNQGIHIFINRNNSYDGFILAGSLYERFYKSQDECLPILSEYDEYLAGSEGCRNAEKPPLT